MDHDRLFKLLLMTFFAEFLALFLPEVSEYVEPGSFQFLDKELFTDLSSGERHEVDLLVRCRFRGQEGFFLIHVEPQSSARGDFVRRMFWYFARLTEEYGLPVYPIALFTYDAPAAPAADSWGVRFPDLEVVSFRFRALQLNRMNWRDFVRRPNPVAAALMTKMNIAPEDRPRVKLECLRLLATLKLDPARQTLIRQFMDAYLRLSAAEMAVYDQEVATLEQPEQEAVMQIVNEWEARGETRGKSDIILRLLRRRFGETPAELRQRIEGLSAPRLEALAEALLDFSSPADAEAWVSANG